MQAVDRTERRNQSSKAIETGGFDLRRAIGNLWAKAIKADAELKNQYVSCGRNYTLQRQFRLAWAKREFVGATAQDKTVERAREEESAIGKYLSLSQIVWEEKNKKAALNYMLFAVAQYRQGIKYANSKAYVNWSTSRKVWQFWYANEEFRASASKDWIHEQQGALTELKKRPAIEAAGAEGSGGGAEPLAKKAKGKGKAKVKEITAGGEASPDDKKQEREKLMKKQVDGNFQKVKVMKTRADGVLSMYHEIIVKSCSDKAWDFVKTKLPELNECKKALDDWKTSNEFWQMWSMSSNFAAEAKKKFRIDDISKHFQSMQQAETTISAFEKCVARLRNMHLANIAG